MELLQVKLQESSEDTVRRQITYRYNSAKSKADLLSAKLADFNAMVKVKNPSLLLQMRTSRLGSPSSTAKRSFRP